MVTFMNLLAGTIRCMNYLDASTPRGMVRQVRSVYWLLVTVARLVVLQGPSSLLIFLEPMCGGVISKKVRRPHLNPVYSSVHDKKNVQRPRATMHATVSGPQLSVFDSIALIL